MIIGMLKEHPTENRMASQASTTEAGSLSLPSRGVQLRVTPNRRLPTPIALAGQAPAPHFTRVNRGNGVGGSPFWPLQQAGMDMDRDRPT
jgi:hypothetical protein